jgi:hypothetical protein
MRLKCVLAWVAGLVRRKAMRCSFCRRYADDVSRLVGGASAYICDECIFKCVAVLEQHGSVAPPATANLR